MTLSYLRQWIALVVFQDKSEDKFTGSKERAEVLEGDLSSITISCSVLEAIVYSHSLELISGLSAHHRGWQSAEYPNLRITARHIDQNLASSKCGSARE